MFLSCTGHIYKLLCPARDMFYDHSIVFNKIDVDGPTRDTHWSYGPTRDPDCLQHGTLTDGPARDPISLLGALRVTNSSHVDPQGIGCCLEEDLLH